MTTPRFIPDHITKTTPAEMYEALERAWTQRFGNNPSRASLLVLLSQWNIETAEGASMHCWNIGNAKSREGDGYNWTNFRCWEVIKGRKVWFDPPHPQTRFRAFDTLDEGAADYLKLLHERFHLSWPAVENGDPSEFAHLLKQQGYYTADETQYANALAMRFNAYLKTIRGSEAMLLSNPLDDVLSVQQALTKLGFNVGTIDGQAGPKTTAAIKAFQKTMGLATDGVVGPLTKAKLLEAWRAHVPS